MAMAEVTTWQSSLQGNLSRVEPSPPAHYILLVWSVAHFISVFSRFRYSQFGAELPADSFHIQSRTSTNWQWEPIWNTCHHLIVWRKSLPVSQRSPARSLPQLASWSNLPRRHPSIRAWALKWLEKWIVFVYHFGFAMKLLGRVTCSAKLQLNWMINYFDINKPNKHLGVVGNFSFRIVRDSAAAAEIMSAVICTDTAAAAIEVLRPENVSCSAFGSILIYFSSRSLFINTSSSKLHDGSKEASRLDA